eukprot:GFKZ01004174.1.p2 GENE.GFKZ01004174.1~~GFKZ01004174.1.p2  ORF type:complete len:107 (-),score=11.41 GFKZ01004174.1:1824-2144(-)
MWRGCPKGVQKLSCVSIGTEEMKSSLRIAEVEEGITNFPCGRQAALDEEDQTVFSCDWGPIGVGGVGGVDLAMEVWKVTRSEPPCLGLLHVNENAESGPVTLDFLQ